MVRLLLGISLSNVHKCDSLLLRKTISGNSGSTGPISIGVGAGVLVVKLPAVGVGPVVGLAPARGVVVGIVVPDTVVADAVPPGVAVLAVKRLVGEGERRGSDAGAVSVIPGVVLGTGVTPGPGSVGALMGGCWVGITAVPSPTGGIVPSAIGGASATGVSPT